MNEEVVQQAQTTARPVAPIVLNVREAAEVLRLGYSTVRKMIDDGVLPTITIGDRRLVTVAALHDFVEQRAKAAV